MRATFHWRRILLPCPARSRGVDHVHPQNAIGAPTPRRLGGLQDQRGSLARVGLTRASSLPAGDLPQKGLDVLWWHPFGYILEVKATAMPGLIGRHGIDNSLDSWFMAQSLRCHLGCCAVQTPEPPSLLTRPIYSHGRWLWLRWSWSPLGKQAPVEATLVESWAASFARSPSLVAPRGANPAVNLCRYDC